MFKITFLGAGSMVFAKSVLGDCMLMPALTEIKFEIAIHDIDKQRLDVTKIMLENLKAQYKIKGVEINAYINRREALRGASYIVNAVQVGGYKPCTVTDFEIPKKYKLRQTIGDTIGIGGIFRSLRTIPVLEDFAEDIHAACPNALFLNYTNPMAILTGYMIRHLKLNVIGLCHSVQVCVPTLLKTVGMEEHISSARWEIAGINHQSWLLKLQDKDFNDLYPLVKQRSLELLYDKDGKYNPAENIQGDLVRHDIMHKFGYYNTESSEHTAEYSPYYIKHRYPELIEKYKIPLDEYITRCINSNKNWEKRQNELAGNNEITHTVSNEYASKIILACETDNPYRVHGNVINNALITNLPQDACVEVPCLIDRNGVSPTFVGKLPEQLAALNRTNINMQLLTVQAAKTLKKEDVYHAAFLDPHTSAELSLDDIVSMCDDLFEAHGEWLPKYK